MSTDPAEAQRRPDQPDTSGEEIPRADALRGLAVILSPSLILDLFAAAGTVAVVSGWVFRTQKGFARLLRPLLVLGAVLPWAYAFVIRPWHLRWGATDEELTKRLPGDELVPDPAFESTRAITINAPVEGVWPWLAQIGQDRGGFYSYEWLENISGARIRSADRIHLEWQHREVGDVVRIHPVIGPKVEAFEPGRAIVLEKWGAYVVEPAGEKSTRLIARSRAPRGSGGMFYHPLLGEFPHFVMERKMLKGIKERAERENARQES